MIYAQSASKPPVATSAFNGTVQPEVPTCNRINRQPASTGFAAALTLQSSVTMVRFGLCFGAAFSQLHCKGMPAVLFNEITGLTTSSRNTGYLLPAVLQLSIFNDNLSTTVHGPASFICRASQAHTEACLSVRLFLVVCHPPTKLCTQTLKATQPNHTALPSAVPYRNVHADASSVGAPRTKFCWNHRYCIPPSSARRLLTTITCTSDSRALSAGFARLPG